MTFAGVSVIRPAVFGGIRNQLIHDEAEGYPGLLNFNARDAIAGCLCRRIESWMDQADSYICCRH